MWAKFPADFTIWFISVFAWGDAVISDSYFTDWACALVDSNATSIGLLPTGIVLFLIPEGLKVCINIVLSLGLLCILLCSWLLISLLWLIVMNLFMVDWLVMNWLVMDRLMVWSWVCIVMIIVVVIPVFWMVSIHDMGLSVFGLEGFMDSLWVHMMVVVVTVVVVMLIVVMVVSNVVVVINCMVVMEGINFMVATIEAINEWVVIEGFMLAKSMVDIVSMVIIVSLVVIVSMVVVVSMVVITMMIIEVLISMVLTGIYGWVSISWSVPTVVIAQV